MQISRDGDRRARGKCMCCLVQHVEQSNHLCEVNFILQKKNIKNLNNSLNNNDTAASTGLKESDMFQL